MGSLQKLLDVEEKLRSSLMFVSGNLGLSRTRRGWKPLCPLYTFMGHLRKEPVWLLGAERGTQ